MRRLDFASSSRVKAHHLAGRLEIARGQPPEPRYISTPHLQPPDRGDRCNAPGALHAFVPKVGIPKPDNWEIAFIAITPRNLKEDTHRVSDEVRALYKQVVGQDAPLGV